MVEEETKKPLQVELGKTLKACLWNVTSASLTTRKQLFQHDLIHCIEHPDLQDGHIRGIAKIVMLTLMRYRDSSSRHVVTVFVEKFINLHGLKSCKSLLDGIHTQSKFLAKPHPNELSASSAVALLAWCAIVNNYYLRHRADDSSLFQVIVEIETLCYSVVCSVSTKRGLRYQQAAKAQLKSSKTPDLFLEYLDVIINNENYQMESLSLIGFIFQYLTEQKQTAKVDAAKKKALLDIYIKNGIQTKVKAKKHCLVHARSFLKYLSHDEFAEVLPILQKSLLRNPEIILEAVGLLLFGLSIDLSKYIDELSKSICSHLISQTESLRADAVQTIEYVTVQCTDPTAVETLLKHLLKVLGGSEGKLSMFEQRMSVISAIHRVTKTTVSGSQKEKLATLIFDGLANFLIQETNENVLSLGLTVLKDWCDFPHQLPASFVEIIKKGVSAKSVTPLTRAQYYQVANHALQGNTLSQGAGLIETLKQTVNKAKTQVHQINIIYECLAASTLLARMSVSDNFADENFDAFWDTVLDPKKNLLVSEKFLATAQLNHLSQLYEFMNVLFLHHSERLVSKSIQPWYHAFIVLFLHADWTIVKKTKILLQKAFDSGVFNVVEFQTNLIQLLHKEVLEYKPTAEINETVRTVSIAKIVDSYAFVCACGQKSDDGSNDEKLKTLMASLAVVHHPVIKNNCEDLFERIVSSLGIDINVFLTQKKDDIIELIMKNDTLDEMYQNVLTTILAISPEVYIQHFLDGLTACLANPALTQVTSHEFGILNTPEGEVYNQSVYESAKAAQNKQGNVKRESKAYSFKEQKEEMELREELRKKKGIQSKAPELNKKQKEQLHQIMADEREIRNRLIELQQVFNKHCTIFSACLKVSDLNLTFGFVSYINVLIGLIKSPLTANNAVKLFIEMSSCLFKDDLVHLGEFVGYTVLRHHNPACEIPARWKDESLKLATDRALDYLHRFVTERNEQIMMAYTWKKPFTAPVFAYCLPLLKFILRDRGSLVKHDEGKRMKALFIISAHAKLRTMEIDDDVDENGPELLPRAAMLQVLSEVIILCDGHNKDGKIQKYANEVFDEVCKAGSGNPGCAFATTAEMEILVGNILSNCSMLRNASLKGLLEITGILEVLEDPVMQDLLTRRVMVARYDMVDDNAKLAESLWEEAHLSVSETLTNELVEDVTHILDDIRLAASIALATSLSNLPEYASDVVTKLLALHEEKTKIPLPVIDNLGRTVSAPFIDPWEARQGIGLALEKIAPHVPEDQLVTLFNFFVPNAFGDRHESVRKQMLDAALQYVNHFGQDHMNTLLNIFQDFLDIAPDSSAHDTIRQSVIILTGSLAKHLQKTDPKIKPIFSKLMAAFATPSQQVQQAVANCLPPLCAAVKDEAPEIIKQLLNQEECTSQDVDLKNQLLESESYGERRGAAFGLAGIVKGLGILSLKQQNIIPTLNEAIQDKKIWRHREGALFAFETLCTMLGRLFEPYVVHLLPHLLLCFGDGNQYVREAADDTAKAVMKNLSNHGVKLVLPSLMKALEEESWRTKTGSAELLGAMSFCAPKQLSSCLPSIVPRLTEVLADSHLKVQKAGQQALRQIGGVIRNPEIQEICPIILDALTDPNKNTVACLHALLNTSFVHFIDAPSLALIMPTLEKALDQRPMETKKMAAQILGNMYELTDPKDLSPYLPAVVPGLKKSLLDPSPEVRGVSSRALGAIVKGMGEDCFNDLMPWLLETLTSEISSVDRSGAAQGLAEVLHALGQERLDKLMPDVIETTMKTDLSPSVRDGYLMLYIYLPATFGDDFLGYIGRIIPSILKGLADESEYVRDTSLKAGQRIINLYSDSAIELLLPQLEAGLFNEHWRIRYSSVQLLGDLLFRLSGVTGKQTTVGEEDDNFGTAHSAQVILRTLGPERRDRVYAGLYMGRSDVALTVRQAALHVWKVIVQNTAKTLREILPVLFELLLGCLACDSHDKRQVAARTLGDLVRKLGERILPEIIPILEGGLDNVDGAKRQGVCIGLSEIMDSTSREMISQFEDSLISTVRKALVDELDEVRHAASLTFENLHNTIGHRALDGVLPDVFHKLDDPALSEYALDGLKQVMAVKSKSVLPFLVPKLTTPPVNIKTLAILSSVAGESLVKHLEKILPAMIKAVTALEGDEAEEAFAGTRTLLLSVEDDVGMRTIVEELLSSAKNANPAIRMVSARLLAVFCKETKNDYSQYVQQLFRYIIQLMNDVDDLVIIQAWGALDALIKEKGTSQDVDVKNQHLDPAEQLQHLPSLRQALRFVKDDIRNGQLPGFCIPKKGITPVLPIFREGILNGSQEIKEQASNVLGEVIKLTSPAALKLSVVHITGPLIRILGDRFNANVKVAILDTLGLLLSKVGILLKPFLPQLQTTFIKALNDPTLSVRNKAAWALGLLTVLHTRVDSLFTELRNGIKNNEDDAIRETILKALRTITLNAGTKMGEAIRSGLVETVLELLDSSKEKGTSQDVDVKYQDEIRVASGAALGALCKILPDDEIKTLLTNTLLDINQTMEWTVCHGRAVALSYALYDAPSKLFSVVDEDEIVNVVVQLSGNDRVPVCTYGVHSLGHLLLFSKHEPDAAPTMVVSSMKKSLTHTSSDIKLVALSTIKHVSRNVPEVLQFDRVRYMIPDFVALLRDRNTAVRNSAELTLAYVLQLHKNDALFDECLSTITEATSFLEDYKKNAFVKLNDAIATDTDDYLFVT